MMTKQPKPTAVALTPEDEALFASVQTRDLVPPPPKLTALLQPNSAKLLEEIAGSAVGDFAVPYNAEYLLLKGADGVPFTPVGFMQRYVEWGAGRSGFVDAHIKKPADA